MNNIPPHPSKDRWAHASCFQKCIRRNLPEYAVPSARFLWGWNPQYLLRRLAVVSFEDIGLANLELLERYLPVALEMLKRREFRETDWAQVEGFVEAFCASPKSRFLTRVGATCHYHPRFKALTAEYHNAILTDRVEQALAETDVLRAQAIALTCNPKELATAMCAEGFERQAALMHLGNRLGGEGLPNILFATRHEKPGMTVHTTLPPVEMMRGFPSFTYDRHTRIGARVLKLFVSHFEELEGLPRDKAEWLAYRILFRAESGLLDREVMFSSDKAVEAFWWETLLLPGLTMRDVFRLRDLLWNNLPLMEKCRRVTMGLPILPTYRNL